MSESREPFINVTRIVVPLAMLAGLLVAAWFAGTEHQRLNMIETTQRAGLQRLQETIDTVQRLQLAIERHQAQTEQTTRMLGDLISMMKKP